MEHMNHQQYQNDHQQQMVIGHQESAADRQKPEDE